MELTGGGFGRGRRILGLGEGVLTSAVVILLVAAVIYAASRPGARRRWDLTAGATYTLGAQTRQVLADLPAPVRVVTIFRPELQDLPNGLAQVQLRAAEYVRNLLAEYEVAASGLIDLEHFDPHANQNEVEEVVRAHRISRYNVVLLTCRGRERQVFLEDLVTIDRGLADPGRIEPAELRAWHGEGPLTAALLTVTDERAPVVAALTGHGEGDLGDVEPFGHSAMADGLRGQGIALRELSLDPGDSVPQDVDAVLVLSPQGELGTRTVESLASFHAGGGGLLLALDPWRADGDLDRFLADVGVLRERAFVCRDDALVEASSRRTYLPARRFDPDHVITASIARQGFFANVSTHGGLQRSPSAPVGHHTPVLLRSEDGVFGDQLGPAGEMGNYQFDEGRERRGPRDLIMAVDGAPGRVVLSGGSALFTNSFLGADQGGPGNMDLLLNSVNWLVHRERAVEARSQEAYESVVKLYEDEASAVRLYVMLLMPLGGAALGLLTWFVRRR